MKNPMCENNRCIQLDSEVRVLPTGLCTADGVHSQGGGSNAILCQTCYHHEMRWRRQRNQELRFEAFKLPAWESLKVYNPGE